jgi:hypothetical protein
VTVAAITARNAVHFGFFMQQNFMLVREMMPRNFWLTRHFISGGLAQILLLMVLEVHLAKVVVAVIAVPARQRVADYTLAYWLVVVIVFSWFYRRLFLLPWLCLHILCLKKLQNLYDNTSTSVPQKHMMLKQWRPTVSINNSII